MCDHRRLEEVAVASSPGQDPCASVDRLLEPLLHALGVARTDERPDVGRLVERIADGTPAIPSSGHPDSSTIRASLSALIGVWLAGRSTIGFPAASAGATLCETRLRGKLKGLMPAIGPSGTRRTCAIRPSEPGS